MGEPTERSDLDKASRDAGVYAYSRAASSLLLMLLPFVGARIYSKPELAFVLAVALIHETAMAIGSMGLGDAVYYFIGREPGTARLVVRQTSFLLLLVAVPVTAVMLVVAWGMSGPELDLVPSLPWMALVLLVELPTQPAVNQMIVTGHARLASGLFVGFTVLRTVAILVPGLFDLDVTTVPMIMGVTGLTRLIVHAWTFRGMYKLEPGEGRAVWMIRSRLKEILWFALPAGAAVMAGKINPQIDKFAAKAFLGVEAFVEYGVVFELPLVTLIPYAVAAIMQARYVRHYVAGDIPALRALWFVTVRKTALMVIPLTMMTLAVTYDLVVVVTQPEYARASLPFRILTLVLLTRIAAFSSILQAVNQPRAVLVATLVLVVSNALLTWPMTRLFGYGGPAVATMAAAVPSVLYCLWRIGKVWGEGIGGALPWGFYGKVLALSSVVAGAVWLGMRPVTLVPGARLAIGCAAFLVIFVPVARLLRLVTNADLRFVWEWLTLRMLKK